MASVKNVSSTKRFGARYGRRLREKVGEIEFEQRSKHKCPYCHARKVKREAIGIWQCQKCHSKFTGKAYSISKKITFKDSKVRNTEITQTLESTKQASAEKEEDA